MKVHSYRSIVSLAASFALLLVLAADVRACPWLITTIPLPRQTEAAANSATEPKPAAPPPQDSSRSEPPVAHGSTLPDEALPRHAPPAGSAPQRGARDGAGLSLRGIDLDPALVLVRELPYCATLEPPHAARSNIVEPRATPVPAGPRRSTGWLSALIPLAPPVA